MCGPLQRDGFLEEDIEIGNNLLKRGQLELAEAHFKELALRDPEHVAPYRALVRISRRLRNRPELLKYLERVLSLEPDALFEGALYALRRGWEDIEATREKLAGLLKIASTQRLTAAVADPLIRVIQFSTSRRYRIEYLIHVRSMLSDTILKDPENSFAEKVMVAELSLALEDYDDVIAAVKEMQTVSDKRVLVGRVRALSYAAKKIAAPSFPDFNAEKVFGIGLSRTGTSSLNAALQILGYQSIHWMNPATRDLIHQQDFLLFDAFTDICVSHQFEWLYYTYPNSKFIMSTRPVQSWSKSVNDHYLYQHGTNGPRALSAASNKRRFRNLGGQMEANLYAHHESWPEAHAAFTKRVHAFFKDKPENRFLEMAIVAGEGWEKLCPFLERPMPKAEFPNLNSSLVELRASKQT